MQLSLTIPLSSVTAERSFSSLRQLRTFLRTKMSQDRLAALALMNIEKNLARTLDLDSAVDIFAKMSTLRIRKSEEGNAVLSESRKLALF